MRMHIDTARHDPVTMRLNDIGRLTLFTNRDDLAVAYGDILIHNTGRCDDAPAANDQIRLHWSPPSCGRPALVQTE